MRLCILTRKTLGGLETDLSARVLTPDGEPLPGLYAAGEVAGFGGGGVHGYRALEGTFLGGLPVQRAHRRRGRWRRRSPERPSQSKPDRGTTADGVQLSPKPGPPATRAGGGLRRHGAAAQEREHAVGVDPHVHGTAVEELLPVLAIARHVHLEQRLAKTAGDLDRHRAAVRR